MNETWWVEETDLDDDQRKVIGLGRDGSHMIIGPPGSGKTNLLLLRANYLCKSDKPNVLILVFTRALREFIAAGAEKYLFSSSKVQTYNGWAIRLLAEHGVEIKKFDDFYKERNYLIKQLNKLIANEKVTSDYYDAILLDEAHDYLVEEIKIINQFSKDLFAVSDIRQQIYRKGIETVEYLKTITETIELRYHYRNGIHICRFADNIMKGKKLYAQLEPTALYNEKSRPSSVKNFRCFDINEQCGLIVKELETQLEAYPEELLGIICPRHEELAKIKEFMELSSLKELCIYQDNKSGYVPFDKDHPICVSTLHGAKGLEFRAIHIAACDTLRSFYRTNRNMIFTGTTRAKTSLSLYYSGDLYGYLESAIANLSPRKDMPKISEAFGKDS